ncbi:hypothetical protein K488DRAFT_51318 [Vararia minispora EC-137]|uniref:Uncharacterized protein n=1 Tax=Vararia minispora EC-137 TaxID=1314806 RepID=A0ACB8QJI0_9AGAM|nr:hypothetical protein K488DRAFT_51318 [Vararia minispora EC-137]
MASILNTVPSEVMEQIAFYAVQQTQIGPPSDLLSLLLVNRRLESTLSIRATPHLYSRIFALKFDHMSHIRRLGSDRTKVRHLAEELRRRFTVLRRIRDGLGCLLGDGQVPSEEDIAVLHEILWTAYVMMLESDDINERQLREYAHMHPWLYSFWFHPSGASWAIRAAHEDNWAASHDLASFALWIFWLSLRPDDYLALEQADFRAMMTILKCYAVGAHEYPIIPASRAFGISAPLPSYGTYPPLTPLPLAFPAILSFLALAPLLSRRSLTQDAVSAPTPTLPQASSSSLEWDFEWNRSLMSGDSSLHSPDPSTFLPGSITGNWEGSFTYVDFVVYSSLLDGAPPSKLVMSPVARHQQTFRLREYHLLGSPEGEVLSDESAPLSFGSPLRAGLPEDVEFCVEGAGIRIVEPYHSEVFYNLALAPEDVTTAYRRRVRDTLILGEGHSAWGQFNLLGRVRMSDGLITISKEYIEGERGTWLYRGYLIGTKNGNLTGRWRDTLSPPDQLGYEGCFFMGRRR